MLFKAENKNIFKCEFFDLNILLWAAEHQLLTAMGESSDGSQSWADHKS